MNEIELLGKAIAFAAQKHCSQTRKDGVAYIYHPLAVAGLVKDAGYGVQYQMTAVLHDVLEDTDATEAEMGVFGQEVLGAVKLLTRPEGADEDAYVEAILANPIAAVVKNADKIQNLWDAPFIGNVGEPRTEKAEAFLRKYIRKADMHYKNKFSYALDDTIEKARAYLERSVVEDKKYPAYTSQEMRLYAES